MGNGVARGIGRRISFAPIPILILGLVVMRFAVKPAIFFEPAWLLPLTNALFVTAVCFIVAYVAMKNYLATGSIQILLLGCGLLAFGLGGVIAGWVRGFPGGANLNVTIYNTAALASGIFHFVAAFILLTSVSPEIGAKQKRTWLFIGYGGTSSVLALITVATLRGIMPRFFVQGVGPTALRQIVLGSADALFVFSFLIFMGWYLRRGEIFLYWYSSALALTAISLTGFFLQSAVGSPIGWLSRSSQYLGGIYFLIAVAIAIRTAQVRKTSIDRALAASLNSSEESFLRTILDNMADRLYVCDHQGNTLVVNQAASRIYGPGENAVPMRVSELDKYLELFEPEGRPLPLSEWPVSRVLRGEHVRATELRVRSKATGKEFIFSYNGEPIRDQNGQITMAVFTSEDITERKRAQEALQESRAKLETALESMTDAVFISDAEGRFQDFNDAFATFYRFKSKAECAKNCVEYPAFLDVFMDNGELAPLDMWAVPRALRGETAANVEYTLRRKDTGEIWVGSYSFGPIRDQDGAIVGCVVVARDITEHKRAEEAIRLSEERLRLLGDNLPNSIVYQYTHDPDGVPRFLYVSAGVERLNGVKPGEVLGDAGVLHRQFLPGELAGLLEAENISARDLSVFEREVQMRLPDGHLRWMHLRSRPRRLPDGRVIWDGVQTDITEHKRAEETLLRSEKLASVGRMAVTIAHEINNPLAAVTNSLFLAQTVENLPEAARQFLETADEELRRVAHITRQALGFYRESNTPALTSIPAVLDSVIDLLKSKVKTKQAIIRKQWEGDVQVTAVAGELRQVFSNFLANSLDAIDEKGIITLRIFRGTAFSTGQRHIRITVADNGKGLSANLRQHLFEPFFTTKGAFGTGLGLWVSKQIIDKHSGAIRVRSRTDGKRRGTVISVVLPAEPVVAASQSAGA